MSRKSILMGPQDINKEYQSDDDILTGNTDYIQNVTKGLWVIYNSAEEISAIFVSDWVNLY